MSCRAFARRIEFATLRALFDGYEVDEVGVAYEPTARNGPTRDFLQTFGALPDAAADVVITRAAFDAATPTLYHRIERVALTEPVHG